MKRKYYYVVLVSTLILVCLPFTTVSVAEQAHGLEIRTAAICRNVAAREPVDAGTNFGSTVGKLCCFTHVTGAQSDTEIYHIWYFVEAEKAVVKLQVRSSNWRTYSSKIIQPTEIGAWRVEVLGPEGDVLKILRFEITQ